MKDVILFLPKANPFLWALNPILSILYNSLSFLITPFSLVSSNSSLLLLVFYLSISIKQNERKYFPRERTSSTSYRHIFWQLFTYLPLLLSPPQLVSVLLYTSTILILHKFPVASMLLNPVDTYQFSSRLISLVDYISWNPLFCFSGIILFFFINHSGHSYFDTYSLGF